MAKSVKRPTLDFGSGHDLMVHEIEPCLGLRVDSEEPAWDFLSLNNNNNNNNNNNKQQQPQLEEKKKKN